MTLQDAIITLKREQFGDSEFMESAKQMGVNALKKQVPKRVVLYTNDGVFKWKNYPCPCCGEMLGLKVNKRYVKFCPNCGQALDWSEAE